MADTFGTESACVGMGPTCLVPQLGAGTVEGQDPQVVRVKGSEMAGDLVVECHGWPRGAEQLQGNIRPVTKKCYVYEM